MSWCLRKNARGYRKLRERNDGMEENERWGMGDSHEYRKKQSVKRWGKVEMVRLAEK
jgi:hypothetical protein